MLSFLKNLFKKEEKQTVTVDLTNLKDFFSSQKSGYLSELNQSINEIKIDIREEIESLKSNIELLKIATLRNPNIPARELHFMEGNRAAYIKKANQLLNEMDYEKDVYGLLTSFHTFESHLNEFGKSTFKPYQILQHFFAEETNKIAQNIKKIDDHYRKIIQIINNNHFNLLQEIENDIEDIFSKIKIKNELENTINTAKKELDDLENNLKDIIKELEQVKNSDEYKEYLELLANIEIIKKKLRVHESIIIHPFSVLDMAMKKYCKMAFEDERLCNQYVENPAETILIDEELKILKMLQAMKQHIESDKIQLKDKKKDKSLEEINKLTKEFFINYKNNRNEIINELNSLKETLNNNNSKELLDKKESEKSILQQQIDHQKIMLNENESKYNKIDIERLKNTIEEKMNKIFKLKIQIN